MVIILLQVLGVSVFVTGSAWLGHRLRHTADAGAARRASRVSHLLFWACLMAPGVAGIIHPGLRAYDALLGLPPLSPHPAITLCGGLMLLAGVALMVVSSHALAKLGRGAASFLLTARVVSEGVYRWTRNPMSLGFYLAGVGLGLAAGSTAVTLGALLVIVPAHLFNLWYFEERELELRMGPSYAGYRQGTPFLLPRFRRGKRPVERPPGG